jgi:hypothetical protein
MRTRTACGVAESVKPRRRQRFSRMLDRNFDAVWKIRDDHLQRRILAPVAIHQRKSLSARFRSGGGQSFLRSTGKTATVSGEGHNCNDSRHQPRIVVQRDLSPAWINAHRSLQAARRKLRGNPDNSTARPRPYECCTETGRNSSTLRRSIPVPIFRIASKRLPPATLQCFRARLSSILGHACAADKRLARRDSLRALESYQT